MATTPAERRARIGGWFREWHVPIKRWLQCRCSVAPKDLEDVVQEVFVRLLRYGDDELVRAPQSYLFMIATNVAHEWRERARNRLPHQEAWLEDIEDETPLTDAELFDEQQQAAILEAIALLPPRAKAIIIYHMHGLTYKTIAKRMGITYRIVLRDLTRAYAQLRGELDSWK